MTPFDPVALLVMLRTFYPVVSVAALRRARRERPEYFAGGELFGTHGEKMRLPDGRVFDLIFDVDGFSGGPRWQVIEPGPEGPPDPFPLEPGPLTPVDVDAVLPPPLEPGFVALVSGTLGEVVRDADRVAGFAGELAAANTSATVDAVYGQTAGAGAAALEAHVAAYPSLDPSDVIGSTGGLGGVISDAQTDYVAPETQAPPEIDVDPAPRGDIPRDGPESPWYQQ